MIRWQPGLVAVLLVVIPACSYVSAPEVPPEPLSIKVINQSDGVATKVAPGSWCFDGLFSAESCVAVDAPVTEVVARCEDAFVVAPPETFAPRPGDQIGRFPAEGGGAWPVTTSEGTVIVHADGSGQWTSASWTFELVRDDGC